MFFDEVLYSYVASIGLPAHLCFPQYESIRIIALSPDGLIIHHRVKPSKYTLFCGIYTPVCGRGRGGRGNLRRRLLSRDATRRQMQWYPYAPSECEEKVWLSHRHPSAIHRYHIHFALFKCNGIWILHCYPSTVSTLPYPSEGWEDLDILTNDY